jgi:alpha-L-fucosidase 2
MGMGAWSEWCMPWAAIIEARMGMREAPRLLLQIWREVFVNEGLTTVYLPRFHGFTAHRYRDIEKPKETHEIMQLEGTCAGVTALYEMLVHTHGGVVKVFPATPSAWADVSFTDLPQPGGLRVSAVRQEGETREIKIHSLRGGKVVLDVPDRAAMTLCRGEDVQRTTFPLELDLRPGEMVMLEV